MLEYDPKDIEGYFVAVFTDEQSDETIQSLFDEMEECGVDALHSFDDGVKVIFSSYYGQAIYDSILRDDNLSPTEYWFGVIDDTIEQFVGQGEDIPPKLYAVLTLHDYIQKDQLEQDGQYESEYREIVENAV